jgi:hypothetical protein
MKQGWPSQSLQPTAARRVSQMLGGEFHRPGCSRLPLAGCA